MKHLVSLLILAGIALSCQTKKEIASDTVAPGIAESTSVSNDSVTETDEGPTGLALRPGRYGDGLRIGIAGNEISGYYYMATGWNEVVKAPQFVCEYAFTGTYTGSASVGISLNDPGQHKGVLEILSPERVRLHLSMNPCENEQPTAEVLTVTKAYPLIYIKQLTASRSHFYSTPDIAAKRKSYLIKGDRVEISEVKDDWYHVIYEGAASVTEGWMPVSAFVPVVSTAIPEGTWLSAPGSAYERYYRFYNNNRYKTWTLNSYEPQGMTGSFSMRDGETLSLVPCGGEEEILRMRLSSAQRIDLMLPGTSTWTSFEKRADAANVEMADFMIEKRQIVTTVNNTIVHIPSRGSVAQFLEAVCPFKTTRDVISRGEGNFDIIRVSSADSGPLFYAIVDNKEISALVIEQGVVHAGHIKVGTTFAEFRSVLPAAKLSRSPIEGNVSGATEDFSYSFGVLDEALFDSSTNSVQDTVALKRIVL